MKDFPEKSSQATSKSLVGSVSSHEHGNTTVEVEQSESVAYGILYIRKNEDCTRACREAYLERRLQISSSDSQTISWR